MGWFLLFALNAFTKLFSFYPVIIIITITIPKPRTISSCSTNCSFLLISSSLFFLPDLILNLVLDEKFSCAVLLFYYFYLFLHINHKLWCFFNSHFYLHVLNWNVFVFHLQIKTLYRKYHTSLNLYPLYLSLSEKFILNSLIRDISNLCKLCVDIFFIKFPAHYLLAAHYILPHYIILYIKYTFLWSQKFVHSLLLSWPKNKRNRLFLWKLRTWTIYVNETSYS